MHCGFKTKGLSVINKRKADILYLQKHSKDGQANFQYCGVTGGPGHKRIPLQTLTKNEESNGHVDEDPGESQELHQVVHKQVAPLQPKVR